MGTGPDRVVNDAYRPMLGDKHEALGRPFLDIWAEARDTIAPQIARALEGESQRFENAPFVLRRGGAPEVAFFDYAFSPVRDESGAVAGIIKTAVETTARVQAEQERERAGAALRGSEQRLRQVLSGMGEAFGVMDHDMRIITQNEAALALDGRPLEEIKGRTHWEVYPGSEETELGRLYKRALAEGVPASLEHRYAWSDGGTSWLEMRAFPVAEGLAVFWRDISERKAAEEALRASEHKYRTLFETIDEGFSEMQVILDEEGHVIDWLHLALNGNFSRVTGIPDITGRLASEVFPNLEGEWFRRMDLAYRTGEPQRFETELAELGRWFDNYITRLGGEDDKRVFGVFGDITERKLAERTLRESEERQAFLLELSDALRPLDDASEIMSTSTRILGAALGANRVFYANIDADGDTAHVGSVFADGIDEAAGAYSLGGLAPHLVSEWRAGRITIIDDVQSDDQYTDAQRAAFGSVAGRSVVGAPLIKGGRFVALLGVNHAVARHWTPNEVALITETAERTCSAVERARAEAALRESEERFRQFGEASQDVLWVRDAGTFQWEYLTPAFETIYGLDRATALRGDNFANWTDLILPEDRARAVANLERVRDGEWRTFEYRIRRPSDGRVCWLRNTDFPMRDEKGRITRIGSVGHNITALKEAELALAAAEQRQRVLLEGMPQLVWRAVDGGEWTWASPQWSAFTGQSERESHDWGWLEALHPDDRDTARAAWAEAMDRGVLDAEYRICHAEERSYRWFHTRASPVWDDRGHVLEWLGTSTDIHDLREMQEWQKVLVAELQHRTRNLLGVVRSMSDKTARASADLPDFRERFRDRLDALARVQGLLSRLDEHDRVTFGALIHAELDAMNGNGDRIRLKGRLARLRSSMVQTLAMAIHELATNAVKYGALGQPDAQLTVTWTLEPDSSGDRSRLHIDWRETGVVMPSLGTRPTGGGQGRELIERALPYQLSAETTYDLGPDGVHCTITIPISRSTLSEEVQHA